METGCNFWKEWIRRMRSRLLPDTPILGPRAAIWKVSRNFLLTPKTRARSTCTQQQQYLFYPTNAAAFSAVASAAAAAKWKAHNFCGGGGDQLSSST